MEFDEDHPLAVVEWGTFATRHLKVGDLVQVPSIHGADFVNKAHAAIVIGIYGHKAEVAGGPAGTEVWDIRDLYWLKSSK